MREEADEGKMRPGFRSLDLAGTFRSPPGLLANGGGPAFSRGDHLGDPMTEASSLARSNGIIKLGQAQVEGHPLGHGVVALGVCGRHNDPYHARSNAGHTRCA